MVHSMPNKIPENLIAELLKDCKSNQDILGENGLLANLHHQIIDTAIQKGICASFDSIDNNEYSDYSFAKSLKLTHKQVIELKNEITSLYADGLSQLQIQSHFREVKNIHLTANHVSTIINMSTEDMELWRDRKLDPIYPIIYMDAMRILVKDNGIQKKKSVHIVLGINLEGYKEVLGLWIENYEGAKIWANILSELKNRGVQDIFIACCDNLSGLSKSIHAIYPNTQVQLCMVHQKRASLACIKRKEQSQLRKDLLQIYTAPTLKIAEQKLNKMAENWQDNYPAMVKSWYHNWENLIPFYEYIPELRKILYTTNAIESLNSGLRTVAKRNKTFGSDQTALNAMYLYLEVARKKWTMPIAHWQLMLNQFKMLFDERF